MIHNHWYRPSTVYKYYFFFTSRRRHTKLVSDWSSDVCSSDLLPTADLRPSAAAVRAAMNGSARRIRQIGRASCRERVDVLVVVVLLKKKKMDNNDTTTRCRIML